MVRQAWPLRPPFPVLSIREGRRSAEGPSALSPGRSVTVTVGLDGSPESLAAAQWAAREALRRAVPLRLLRARRVDEDPRTRVVDPATARAWGERTPATAERRLRFATRAWTSADTLPTDSA